MHEVTTKMGVAGIGKLDIEEFTELGISPLGSSGGTSWMKEDTKPNLEATSNAPV